MLPTRSPALLLLPLALLLPGSPSADTGICTSADPTDGTLTSMGDVLASPALDTESADAVMCTDTCGPRRSPGEWAGDGVCDDGGPSAKNQECSYGTDCTDCGPRGCDAEHPCGEGFACQDSECVYVLGEVPECVAEELEPMELDDGNGSELTQFEPNTGDGWWDYPENGETEDDEYRSYLRRDVQQLVKYAASWTRCLGQDWAFGNGEPIGLGDMSEADGDIPGMRERDPGHPNGTHLWGKDIDVAYYRLSGDHNKLVPICEHIDHKGRDQRHCVSAPDDLDVMRTAVFLAKLMDSSRVRIIGVDGQIGPLVEDAWERLCEEGFLASDSSVCRGHDRLAYETTDRGNGWYRFHHHHLHLSTYGGKSGGPAPSAPMPPWRECLVPGCGE